jgi:hypothetical protein
LQNYFLCPKQAAQAQLLFQDEVNDLALSLNQLQVVHQKRPVRGDHHHTHISRLDISCSNDEMKVNLGFDAPFHGVVYSKGYFNDPACRYLTQN